MDNCGSKRLAQVERSAIREPLIGCPKFRFALSGLQSARSHAFAGQKARLLRDPPLSPWIATSEHAGQGRQRALEQAGARVLRLPADPDGRVNLASLLERLGTLGITCLMVEGGARIITSFLRQRLADLLVLTVSPLLVGGLHAVEDLGEADPACFPRLKKPRHAWRGEDLILWGELA